MIFGRMETFAIEVRPLGTGPKHEDPASAATWSAMELHIGGKNRFLNISRGNKETSDSINWPSIFLARWFVRSWSQIFHTPPWPRPGSVRNARDMANLLDEELSEQHDLDNSVFDQRDSFVQSHALRAAAAGAAMPDIWIGRDLDVISISWNDSMDGDRFFPMSRGEIDINPNDFAEAVQKFVVYVHQLLVEAKDPRLESDILELQTWLNDYVSEETGQQAILSHTGLSNSRFQKLLELSRTTNLQSLFGMPDNWAKQGTLADTQGSAIALAFRCASPTLNDQDLLQLRHTILNSASNKAGFTALDNLAQQITYPYSETHDFTRGYTLARSVRAELNNPEEPINIDELLDSLHIPIKSLSLDDDDIDAACVCDDDHGPLILINPKSKRATAPWGRSMALAHELCHLLFDRERAVSLAVVSGPWAPPRIERVANAFAIELLLPLKGIRATVGEIWDNPSDDDVNTLMEKYQLGITAVTEHLGNMRRICNRQD